jgi:uncharacterized SAM-binding protein YcdF (DUF218 family)
MIFNWLRCGRLIKLALPFLVAVLAVAAGAVVQSDRVAVMLSRILGKRFPDAPTVPADLHGIIVLGGDLGVYPDGPNRTVVKSPRITAAIPLAVRYPHAVVVVSGGFREAEDGLAMLVAAGISPTRIGTEGQSRSTLENARFTSALVGGDRSKNWLLVTSRLHLPRAVGTFRQAGFNVTGVPAAVNATPQALPRIARHEMLALVAYRLAGHSSSFLPGQEN